MRSATGRRHRRARRLRSVALAAAAVAVIVGSWMAQDAQAARVAGLRDASQVAERQATMLVTTAYAVEHLVRFGEDRPDPRLARAADLLERSQRALEEGGPAPALDPGAVYVLPVPSDDVRGLLTGPEGPATVVRWIVDASRRWAEVGEHEVEALWPALDDALAALVEASGLLADERDAALAGLARWRFLFAVTVASVVLALAVTLVVQRNHRRTARHFRAMFDQVDEQVVRFGLDDLVVSFCNSTWAERFRRSPDELVGRPVTDPLSCAERELVVGSVERIRSGTAPAPNTTSWVDAEGVARVTLWLDHLLVDRHGRREVLSVGRDVTELVRARDEVAASERRYRRLLDQLPAPAFVLGQTGEVQLANRAATELFGAGAARSGRPVHELIHPDDRSGARHRLTGPDADRQVELRALAADDTWRTVLARSVDVELGAERALLVVLHDHTEERAAELALAEAEHRERSVLDGLAEAVLLHDHTGRITFANQRAAELFGEPSPDDLLGLHTDTWLTDAIAADGSLVGRAGLIGRALVTGRSYEALELRLHDRWLRVSARPLHDLGPGRPVGVVCSLSDVSGEHRARRAQERLEARYRNVVEQLTEGLVVLAEDGALVSINDAAAALLGSSDPPADADAFHLTWQLLDEQGAPLARESSPVWRTLSTGEPQRGVVIGLRDGRGRQRWLSTSTQLIRDEGARQVVVLFSDITERRDAEARLAASESRFRFLTETSSDLVIVHDHDGRFTYLSPSVRELLGYEPEALIGTWAGRLVHPDDRLLRDAVDGSDAPRRSELRLRRADGDHRWFEVVWRPVRDHAGRLTEVHGVARDVQERHDTEHQLRHLATHDPLTGLANRVLLRRRLDEALTREPGTTALLLIDLDEFKPVNDRYGHDAGDELLRVVAERLERRIRPGDTAARIGGDEFVVVARGLHSAEEARALARRLESDVRAPITLRTGPVRVEASVGVAMAETEGTVEGLLDAADRRMYRRKRARRRRLAPPPSSRPMMNYRSDVNDRSADDGGPVG